MSEHITATVCRGPGVDLRAWCICGWWGPSRIRQVHATLDRKAHERAVRLAALHGPAAPLAALEASR